MGDEKIFCGVVSLTGFPYKPRSVEASWRSGYAEDCKSLHPSSILGEASNFPPRGKNKFRVCALNFICYSAATYSLIAQLVEHSTVNRIVAGSSPARGAKFEGLVMKMIGPLHLAAK